MRVALVYDRLNKVGGAEVILQTLHEAWPRSPWYTAVYNPATAPFAKDWDVHASALNRIAPLRTRHELVPHLMPFVFENMDFDGYDVVLSVSSAEAKGIITKPETLHINYCLTPTRYLWSHRQDYQDDTQLQWLKTIGKPALGRITRSMQAWDQVAATRPDIMMAIIMSLCIMNIIMRTR